MHCLTFYSTPIKIYRFCFLLPARLVPVSIGWKIVAEPRCKFTISFREFRARNGDERKASASIVFDILVLGNPRTQAAQVKVKVAKGMRKSRRIMPLGIVNRVVSFVWEFDYQK